MRLPKWSILVIACSFLIANVNASDNITQIPASNFSINTPQLTGSLQTLKGKVVYVDFWASWCKPCRKSFPWMNEMQTKYEDAGLQVIAINLDSEHDLAQTFLAKVPTSMPIVYDPQGNIAKSYQLVGMPSSYIVDKNGQLRFAHKGFFSDKQSQYELEIKSLLNEQE